MSLPARKILAYSEAFGTTTTTFIYNEVKAQARRHEVQVVCLTYGDRELFPYSPVVELGLEPYSRIRMQLFYRLQQAGWYWNSYDPHYSQRLRKAVEDFQPELIHAHFGNGLIRFFDLCRPRPEGIPVVVSFHGYDASQMLRNPAYCRRLRSLLQRPDVFPVYASEHMKQNLLRAGMPAEKGTVIYYGIDTEQFQPGVPPSEPKKRLLQVSSFREKKGHRYTLEAFAQFLQAHQGPPVELILAGGGPGKEEIEALAQELGLQDQVTFPGWVTHAEARDLMKTADVFLHHSITPASTGDEEGVPNALIEAMAMELPVLSTQHAGIPELVIDGEHGFLVPERDVTAYARRLADILPWSRQPENRKRIQEQFSLEVHNRQLAEWYQHATQTLATSVSRPRTR